MANLALDQQSEGTPFTCVVIFSVVGLLLLILVALYAYQKYVASKRPIEHLCDYCGHMVNVVSDCHHSPVKEKFLHGICQECKKECRLVCARCKRPV